MTTKRKTTAHHRCGKRPLGHRVMRPPSDEASAEQNGGGRSQSDIAAMYGVSRGMISKIERRALKKIRKAVEDAAASCGLSVSRWLFGEEK